ncbi:hypothetical protein EsH8_VII_000619 [Colletotrichum jinshuiense]
MSGHDDGDSVSTNSASETEKITFWDTSHAPKVEDDEIQRFIYGPSAGADEKLAIFEPEDDKISAWEDASNKQSHCSFGDSGVTASVSAYGDLMQFSSYLGAGRSGIFSADHIHTEEPVLLYSRARSLMKLSWDEDRQHITYGLQVSGMNLKKPRHLGYVHDRWPRYEFVDDDKNSKLTIQWIVHEQTLLQQCLVENTGKDDLTVPFLFKKDMHIRDLDYVDQSYAFNESQTGQDCKLGPNGFGLVIVRPLPNNKPEEKVKEGNDTAKKPQGESTKDDIESKTGTPVESSFQTAPPIKSGAVAVAISVFLNGKAIQWNMKDEEPLLEETLKSGAVVEVVTAYRMLHLPGSHIDWKDVLVQSAAANVSKYLISEPFTSFFPSQHEKPAEDVFEANSGNFGSQQLGSTSSAELEHQQPPDKRPPDSSICHIDFVIRRKLEHILSVCAIPVERENGRPVTIALTCGDISGHLVSSSASFFSFQFLLDIRSRMDTLLKSDLKSYYESMRNRIDTVCRGHLRWLSKAHEESNGFAESLWPTGNIIHHSERSSIPNNSVLNAAFHIIKAFDFARQFEKQDDLGIARRFIQGVTMDWILSLEKLDKRRCYVWPHAQVEGYDCDKYRLNEHVWIWRALKLLNDDLRQPFDASPRQDGREAHRSPASSPTNREKDKISDRPGQSSRHAFEDPNKTQREILQRFTTENDVSKKRMLATTRTSRKTRFLFHASDTALFYGVEWNFFLRNTSFEELWENTMEAQIYHAENLETRWDDSIRYALAIMAGTRNRTVNKQSPQDLVRSSLGVLLQTIGPNGLFYGSLDSATEYPTLPLSRAEREFYFHASFEIPYILLTHCRKIDLALKNSFDKDTQPPPQSWSADPTAQRLVEELAHILNPQKKQQSPAVDAFKWKRSEAISMKKSMPFNTLFDQSSVIELGEEWLYNYPAFFTVDHLTSEELKQDVEDLQESDAADTISGVVLKGARSYKKKFSDMENSGQWPGPEPLNALDYNYNTFIWFVDVPKRNHLSKQQAPFLIQRSRTNFDFWKNLAWRRTADNAKKRFIWLPDAQPERALICYSVSPVKEKTNISLFFDRHCHYENHFLDETTIVLNHWESELHLSFYRLVDENYKHSLGVYLSDTDVHLVSPKKKLLRASMGYRFLGDFFDRYWTCHFIEYIPGGKGYPRWRLNTEPNTRDFPWGSKQDLVQEQECWRQRKVLELHLFDRILKELVQSSTAIFDIVRREVEGEYGGVSSSIFTSDDYFSSSVQWQKYQYILQVVDEDLSKVRSIVSKWEMREKDRGHEKPRWTRNDERKYRTFIRKLEGTTGRRIRDLQNLHINIISLKERLITSQQHVRDDLSLRGAENIRFFTYVTVVFLPLGFAASIFSMSDAPPDNVLIPMVICSVVALVVTVVALSNAKRLNAIVEQTTRVIDSYSRAKMKSSTLAGGYKRKQMRRKSSGNDAEKGKIQDSSTAKASGTSAAESYYSTQERSNGRSDERLENETSLTSHQANSHTNDISWHVWFWLAYLLVELPARRVSVAFSVLNKDGAEDRGKGEVASEIGNKASRRFNDGSNSEYNKKSNRKVRYKPDGGGQNNDAKNKKFMRLINSIRVVVGIIILPVFIVTFLFQLFAYNLADLVRLSWGKLPVLLIVESTLHY